MSDPIRDALIELVEAVNEQFFSNANNAIALSSRVIAANSRAVQLLLRQPETTAPPPAAEWPELPDCPEEWRTGDRADTEYVGGLRVGYRNARNKLAAMNPNHQENCQ